jgi:hypothetical protein
MKNHGSSNDPSMDALLNARYSPQTTGSVSKMGTHPARGLTWFSSYRRLISMFMRSGSSLYFSRTASVCGARFWMFKVASTWLFVNGYVSAFTTKVVKMMELPRGYGTPCFSNSACVPSTNASRRSEMGLRMPSMRCAPVSSAASDAAPDTASSASAKEEPEAASNADASSAAAASASSATRAAASVAAASTCGAMFASASAASAPSAATGATEGRPRRRASTPVPTSGDAMPFLASVRRATAPARRAAAGRRTHEEPAKVGTHPRPRNVAIEVAIVPLASRGVRHGAGSETSKEIWSKILDADSLSGHRSGAANRFSRLRLHTKITRTGLPKCRFPYGTFSRRLRG